jgi:hypothetical protein
MTITLQIGNSDNKLTQQTWSEFVAQIDMLVQRYSTGMHFAGTSEGGRPWQNACWVFECANLALVKEELARLAATYRQDAIAVTAGQTEMVPAG